ncbi:MAG: hypothetical protein KatS3mg104_1275 [Phycisphaerae bacterium]|jgi:putative nucleotidyltransferase with HDIG domain|nr:MAG: hypothetical protein KatS3mg104_1275 [Phycisphaerae bacterium]
MSHPTSQPVSGVPNRIGEFLARKSRENGLCLIILSPNGQIHYSDAHAATFFQRFAIPLLTYGTDGKDVLSSVVQIASRDPMIHILQPFPGILLSAFAHQDRRQLAGVVILLGRCPDWKIDDKIVESCRQFGVDPDWLAEEANKVSPVDQKLLLREARYLLDMLNDRIRLRELEQEVESLSTQLSNTYEELNLIYRLSGGMKVNRSAGDFFKQACLDLMQILQVRGIGVDLRVESLAHYEPVVYGSISFSPGVVRRLADELTCQLKIRKSPLVIHHLDQDPDFHWLSQSARQILAVPLQRDDQVLGTLFAFDKQDGEFDSTDAKLLTSIADESAIYLQNAMLFADVRGLMMGLLHSLVSAVDAKDAYTCGHSERVALIARELAQVSGLVAAKVERVYMAGLLHDVGKIGVPEAVLQKPGRLTDAEFDLMKQHPEIGARILRDVRQLEDVIPGVLHHHERFDGRGYPSGLAGENIPLLGRIICLADCFDAMTSNRTYRRALPFEVAMMEIKKGSGTQFDPVLAQAFMDIGEKRLRELTSAHHEQASRLIELHSTNLKVA